jgi:hypothetical protein
MTGRLTIRLGSLAAPLAAWCKRHGSKPAAAVRIAIAKMLRVSPPEMHVGHPDIAALSAAGVAARKAKRKKASNLRKRK